MPASSFLCGIIVIVVAITATAVSKDTSGENNLPIHDGHSACPIAWNALYEGEYHSGNPPSGSFLHQGIIARGIGFDDEGSFRWREVAKGYSPEWGASGELVFVSDDEDGMILLLREGDVVPVPLTGNGYREPNFSPDGSVVFEEADVGIWIMNPVTGEAQFLTEGGNPSVSHDGKHVVFRTDDGIGIFTLTTSEVRTYPIAEMKIDDIVMTESGLVAFNVITEVVDVGFVLNPHVLDPENGVVESNGSCFSFE